MDRLLCRTNLECKRTIIIIIITIIIIKQTKQTIAHAFTGLHRCRGAIVPNEPLDSAGARTVCVLDVFVGLVTSSLTDVKMGVAVEGARRW